ncbi:VOC family protein [Flavobacterium sp. RSP49]|uniref:VOC family protein n=1 Tax=Flavobacterium sp. RSP49 TaxID=2497487 RepID=UPI000F8393C7|nr:VOC family protein [Flavobacterium sp. RSP49]RTZ01204.1 VOC family protein [Flavobacterium sp. RSP49]
MHNYLSGIQQIGIGVKNAQEAMNVYKSIFGLDVLIFDDVAQAKLMSQYTGNKIHERRAILTMNLQGGGGFEIWQFLDRTPIATNEVNLGDLGIYSPKIKSLDIKKSYNRLSNVSGIQVSAITKNGNSSQFWVKDQYGNNFNIVFSSEWFQNGKHDTGGVCGAVIGVSDMERSLHFYKEILGVNEILYDNESTEADGNLYRKVGLFKKATGKGAFNKLLGSVEIELIQILNKTPKKIYENKYWGDCGFIHLCLDVLDMKSLKLHSDKNNYNFTVDSNNTFEMDSASGRFCYIEDPDGTLIELVETHKVPIFKKIGWFLDLRKRDFEKPLPNWMIKMLALSKVK